MAFVRELNNLFPQEINKRLMYYLHCFWKEPRWCDFEGPDTFDSVNKETAIEKLGMKSYIGLHSLFIRTQLRRDLSIIGDPER